MSTTSSKAALLDAIERERLIWEQLLAVVGEARMEQPGSSFSHLHDEHEPALTAWLDRIGRAA